MGELARRYKLSTEFIQNVIEQRMETLVTGSLHHGHIFTTAHVSRIKSQVKSFMDTSLVRSVMSWTSKRQHGSHAQHS